MSSPVYAIILAGGNGERFWPLSDPERPKQFVDLFGGKTLIRHAVDRLAGFVPPERTIVITNERLVRMTRSALPMVPAANIYGEPCRRDTAAAVATACGLIKRLGGEDAVGCVLAADHLIEPADKFRRVLEDAVFAAEKTDAIVTLGIKPTSPATGYGYIEAGEKIAAKTKTAFNRVKRFVEKPDLKTAKKYLAKGNFRWNAGMFIWKATVLERAFREHAPDLAIMIDAVSAAKDLKRLLKREYSALRAISFDYAVMEKATNVVVAECPFDWDDVGSWTAVGRHFAADSDGNVIVGEATTVDTTDSIICGGGEHTVAVLGMKDVIVVHTPRATLVCAKDKAPELKRLVRSLKFEV